MGATVQRDHCRLIELAAAGLLGVAVAFAVYTLADRTAEISQWTVGLASGAATWWLSAGILRTLAGDPGLALPAFELTPFEFAEQPLTAAHSDEATEEDELLLEDVLNVVSDQSQVIRLFDPALMPTAGELHERIDRHLATGPRPVPDSTQELYAALSALRHSLR